MKNDELETLLQQKKEIDARVRELRRNTIRVGNTKFEQKVFPTGIVEWVASVQTRFDVTGRPHFAAVARQPKREDAIKELEQSIKDLTELLRSAKKQLDAQNGEEKEE